jgi:hypothetical protein
VPSLLGPTVAGLVAEHLSWRAVFLIGVALLVPAWASLRPALVASASVEQPETGPDPDHLAAWRDAACAVLAAVGIAALTTGAELVTQDGPAAAVGTALVVGGLVALVPAVRVLMPAGTLAAARGIPALTALRGLLGAAFGTTAAFLPLMLAEVRHYGAVAAGVSLSITGVSWAAGSQLQGLGPVQRTVPVPVRLQVGFGLLTLGLAGPALVAAGTVGPVPGLALWAVAGLGIGVCSPTISNHVLTLSAGHDQGRNSAASVLSPALAQALALAAAGTAVAVEAPHLSGTLFASVMGAAALLGLAGFALAPRAALRTCGP